MPGGGGIEVSIWFLYKRDVGITEDEAVSVLTGTPTGGVSVCLTPGVWVSLTLALICLVLQHESAFFVPQQHFLLWVPMLTELTRLPQ